jgi:hypothetical protein
MKFMNQLFLKLSEENLNVRILKESLGRRTWKCGNQIKSTLKNVETQVIWIPKIISGSYPVPNEKSSFQPIAPVISNELTVRPALCIFTTT